MEEEIEEDSGNVDDFSSLQVAKWNHKQKIFLIGTDDSNLISNDIKIVELPNANSYAKYMICNNTLFEIQRSIDEPSSWFVGDSIQSGRFYEFVTDFM